MPKLFEKTVIKSMELGNRFVRSATWEGMAETDGSCTQKLIDVTTDLAKGGVGLIITGHAYVKLEGKAGPWQISVHSDEMIPSLQRMTSAVHEAGGKIALQISHAGCYAFVPETNTEAVGPSPGIPDTTPPCRELTKEEISDICAAFGKAAARAKSAGFDAIQIHAAHGYLLSQFLSPFFNRRTDNYGGSVENRSRIVLEVFRTIRQTVGKEYPILIKLNSQDFVQGGGLSVDDMLTVSSLLEKEGIDAIEMSGGTIYLSGEYSAMRNTVATEPNQELYYRDAAARFKKTLSTPLMLVGGARSLEVAEQAVAEGFADYISLCRPLMREPGLIGRWRSGDTRKSACLSENACLGALMKGKGLQCVIKKGEL